MPGSISHVHHYVPQWYQRQFIREADKKLWYLDLKPETVKIDQQRTYTKKPLHKNYPVQCFWSNDLYSLRFGRIASDIIERIIFGRVDDRGERAVRHFTTPELMRDGIHEAYTDLVTYITAQRLRTPRGLDWLRKQTQSNNTNAVLATMTHVFDAEKAMLMEGTWEIVNANHSPTKFIISDDPVTYYNRKIFPGETPYPGSNDFPKVGTRTIFPLGPENCLIITHLQLIRDPWSKPLEQRVHARTFGQTIASLTAIQHSRELEEQDVLRINYILKTRATKYIGASRKADLYPETSLGRIDWAKLDDDWFLFPNVWKVPFTTGIIMGGAKGRRSFAIDEYGRNPGHPEYEDKRRRAREHESLEAGKREWAKRRIGKPLAQTLQGDRENTFYDRYVKEYLQEQGLIQREEAAAE